MDVSTIVLIIAIISSFVYIVYAWFIDIRKGSTSYDLVTEVERSVPDEGLLYKHLRSLGNATEIQTQTQMTMIKQMQDLHDQCKQMYQTQQAMTELVVQNISALHNQVHYFHRAINNLVAKPSAPPKAKAEEVSTDTLSIPTTEKDLATTPIDQKDIPTVTGCVDNSQVKAEVSSENIVERSESVQHDTGCSSYNESHEQTNLVTQNVSEDSMHEANSESTQATTVDESGQIHVVNKQASNYKMPQKFGFAKK